METNVNITSLNGTYRYFVQHDGSNWVQSDYMNSEGIAILQYLPKEIGSIPAEVFVTGDDLYQYNLSLLTYEHSKSVEKVNVLYTPDSESTWIKVNKDELTTGEMESEVEFGMLRCDIDEEQDITFKVKDAEYPEVYDVLESHVNRKGIFKATFVVTEGDLEVELPLVENGGGEYSAIWGTIILPLETYEYDFYIDWGDGSPIQHITDWDDSNRFHVYPEEGEYQITVTGTMQMWRYADYRGEVTYIGTAQHLKSIDQTGAGFCDNVVDFSGMFATCSNLESLCVLNTSLNENSLAMFYGCSSLETIPLLDTSNNTVFTWMFMECSSLETIPLLDTSNGVYFNTMFANCVSLLNIPLLDVSSGKEFGQMFTGCTSLNDVPELDASSGEYFIGMFYHCISLENIILNDVSSGISFRDMFGDCSSLKSVKILNSNSVGNFGNMFDDCTSLETIYNFDLSSAINVTDMFKDCVNLQNVNIANISKSISFEDCVNLPVNSRNLIYYNLAEVADETITMSSLPITGENRSVAENKGWTVLPPE